MEQIFLNGVQLADLLNAVRFIVKDELQKNRDSKEILPESDQLLTVHQAAKFLSLAVPTVYGLISKGEIPVMKRSKRCYFSKIDLINYLKVGRKKSNAEIQAEADQYLNNRNAGQKKGGSHV